MCVCYVGLGGRGLQLTLITTGWMVAPNSKQPFLNMNTPVLLIQVPGDFVRLEREREREDEGGSREGERERENSRRKSDDRESLFQQHN